MPTAKTHTALGSKSSRSLSTEGKPSRRARTPEAIKAIKKDGTRAGANAPAPKVPEKPRRIFFRGTNLLPPGFKPEPCVEGTKQAILVDILSRPEGATMEELLEATSGGRRPWIEATVRSAFGWDLKRKGYGVRSSFDAHGIERFHLIPPKGQRIPPHTSAGALRKHQKAMKHK